MQENLSIINKTKSSIPVLPFSDLKDDILGKKYELSVAFVAPKESQKINLAYRNKDKPTNILSFPFSKTEGEIIICPSVVKKEAPKFERDFENFLGFLVIHGMLHLKGMEHGSIMERAEKKYDTKYFRGNRSRLQHDESRGGRVFQRRKIS